MANVEEMEHATATGDGETSTEDPWTQAKKRKRNDPVRNSNPEPSDVSDLDEDFERESKREKVPPIITEAGEDWQNVIKHLKRANAFFSAKFVGRRLHILCSTITSFRTVQRELTALKLPFHTFALKEEAELKTVIRGLPPSTSTDDIMAALQDLGFTPVYVQPLERREKTARDNEGKYTRNDTKIPTNSFLVRFRKTGSWAKIWELDTLLDVRVSVDQFSPRPGLPQCFRCQRFHHSSTFCQQEPRCVKCAGPHLRTDCRDPPENAPKCCNCSGKHPASWKGCAAHKRLQGHQRRREAPSRGPPTRGGPPAQLPAPRDTRPANASRPASKNAPPARANSTSRRQEPRGVPRAHISYAAAVSQQQPKPRRHRCRRRKNAKAPDACRRKAPQDETSSDEENEHEQACRVRISSKDSLANTKPASKPQPLPSRSRLAGAPHPRARDATAAESTNAGKTISANQAPSVSSTPAAERQTDSLPVDQSPRPGFVSVTAILQWISTIVPIVLKGPALPANELLAAILNSLDFLLRHA